MPAHPKPPPRVPKTPAGLTRTPLTRTSPMARTQMDRKAGSGRNAPAAAKPVPEPGLADLVGRLVERAGWQRTDTTRRHWRLDRPDGSAVLLAVPAMTAARQTCIVLAVLSSADTDAYAREGADLPVNPLRAFRGWRPEPEMFLPARDPAAGEPAFAGDASEVAGMFEEYVLPVLAVVPGEGRRGVAALTDMRQDGDAPVRWLTALGGACFLWAGAGYSLAEAVRLSSLPAGHPDAMTLDDLAVMGSLGRD